MLCLLIKYSFSYLKKTYNKCAIPQQVSKQASVARILLAEFFWSFFYLTENYIAQVKEDIKNLSLKTKTSDSSQNDTQINLQFDQTHIIYQHHLQLLPYTNLRTKYTLALRLHQFNELK